MELYAWVHALSRFAVNAHEAEIAIAEIIGSAEVVVVKIVIFSGFLYSLYIFARRERN